jgi:hypothetical protein
MINSINKYKVKGDTTVLYAYKAGKIVEVIIDTADLPKLLRLNHTWSINSVGYVICHVQKAGIIKRFSLSRFLLDYEGKLVVDHLNWNPLDNRRLNLRLCTRSQNCCYRQKAKGVGGRVGVTKRLTDDKWIAYIQVGVGTKIKWLGAFVNFEDAVRVRRIAEQKYFGEFASNL